MSEKPRLYGPDGKLFETAEKEKPAESVSRIITSLAEKRYADEHVRTKDIEGKAGPALSVASTLLVLGATLFNKAPECLVGSETKIYTAIVWFGILYLFVATGLLLSALFTANYKYFEISDWATEKDLRRPDAHVGAISDEIAVAYQYYISQNEMINNSKAKRYRIGTMSLALGVAILVIAQMYSGCGMPRIFE